MITLRDIELFRRRSLRDKPKDVYLVPVYGSKPMLATYRSPGCRYLGRYTETVTTGELLEDVDYAWRELATA